MTGPALERAIAELERRGHQVKRTRTGGSTTCTHDGADNPTALSIFDNGSRIRFTCFTRGCSSDEVAETLGLKVPDLYHESKGRQLAVYRYDDGRAVIRSDTAQKPGKGFSQDGTKGARTSLYRAKEVAEAVRDGRTVYLVEGEEDVHSLEAVGCVATTAPMGARNFSKVDPGPLCGASVVAVRDNDDDGLRWTELVREHLSDVAGTVRFVRPAKGKDASDHLAADLGVEAFVSELSENQPPTGDARHLRFRTIRELRAEVEARGPRQWLVRGVITAGSYGVHGGVPKAQKSWNALDLAVSVASGTPWLGRFDTDTTGPVQIFAGEGDDGSLLRRLDAIGVEKGVTIDDLPVDVCCRAPHLGDLEHLAEMRSRLSVVRPALVVLDPFYLSARGGKLTDLYEMGALLEAPQRLCQAVGASLLVVHHFNRNREGKGADRFSGAGPAEWGRFLIGASVISRHTDTETQQTSVTAELEVIGGEVPDQTFRVNRTVRAEDPDDLDSALMYSVHVTVGSDIDLPTIRSAPGATPAAQRVFAVLSAASGPLTVQAIGDELATSGHPLKKRTIQDALSKLGPQVEGLEIDARGTTEWSLAREAAA